MVALDPPNIAYTLLLHCSSGALLEISLILLYLSHLRSDQPETCSIRFRSIKIIYFKPKIVTNGTLIPLILSLF